MLPHVLERIAAGKKWLYKTWKRKVALKCPIHLKNLNLIVQIWFSNYKGLFENKDR